MRGTPCVDRYQSSKFVNRGSRVHKSNKKPTHAVISELSLSLDRSEAITQETAPPLFCTSWCVVVMSNGWNDASCVYFCKAD